LTPSDGPTKTEEPTSNPSVEPTDEPTVAPTVEPSSAPSAEPTTGEPTSEPTTGEPTSEPTTGPTGEPTEEPTAAPTSEDDVAEVEEDDVEDDNSMGTNLAPTGSCQSWVSDDLDMCGRRVETAIESENCWCDYLCTRLVDCCEDFTSICEDYIADEGDETLYKWRLEYVALEIRVKAMLHDEKIIPDQMITEMKFLAERDAISERMAIKDHIHNSMQRRRFRR